MRVQVHYRRLAAILVLFAALFASPLAAAQVLWTDWVSSATGPDSVKGLLPGGIDVTYTGDYAFVQLGPGGTNYWDYPVTSPYVSATVPNGPSTTDIIAITGESSAPFTTHKIEFSSPVTNPLMAIVSLGQPSVTVFYNFSAPFDVLSSGEGHWGGSPSGSLFEDPGNVLRGVEGHGTIRFLGTFSSITWTAAPYEYWHGFTVGMVPEPGTYAMLLAGLAALAFVARRRARG